MESLDMEYLTNNYQRFNVLMESVMCMAVIMYTSFIMPSEVSEYLQELAYSLVTTHFSKVYDIIHYKVIVVLFRYWSYLTRHCHCDPASHIMRVILLAKYNLYYFFPIDSNIHNFSYLLDLMKWLRDYMLAILDHLEV